MKSTINFQGIVTVQVEDANGNVKRRETCKNDITDTFLNYLLASMTSNYVLGIPLRIAKAGSNAPVSARAVPCPEQYNYEYSSTCPFALYTTNDAAEVTKDTVVPPYIGANGVTLGNNVSFYANYEYGYVNGNSSYNAPMPESAKIMVPVDSLSGFSAARGDAKFKVQYMKTIGTGVVRSVIFGRRHADLSAIFGTTFALPLSGFGTTRAASAIEHQINKSVLWKSTTSTPVAFDLTNTTFNNGLPAGTLLTSANISTLLNTSSEQAAGSVVAAGSLWRADYASNSGTNITVTLNRWYNSTTVQTRTITFTRDSSTPFSTLFRPITIYRPDNDTIEIFMATAYGTFAGQSGAMVQKAVLSNLDEAALANVDVDISNVGVFNIVPGSYTSNMKGLGFYDHVEQQYYLPCGTYSDGGSVEARSNSSFTPGYVFDASTWSVEGEWTARCETYYNSSFAASFVPVRTSNGIAFAAYDTSTPVFGKFGQVFSGVVLPTPVEKGELDTLRITYEYSLA
jgi:hypothetical protein